MNTDLDPDPLYNKNAQNAFNAKKEGLFKKYHVSKLTNPSKNVDAIVLEFDDPIARPGIVAFADNCRRYGYAKLADDIIEKCKKMPLVLCLLFFISCNNSEPKKITIVEKDRIGFKCNDAKCVITGPYYRGHRKLKKPGPWAP